MKAVVKLLLSIVLWPLSTLLGGYVLQLLWEWFIVPQFNLAPLPMGIACGLRVVTFYLSYQAPPRFKTQPDESGWGDFSYSQAAAFIVPLIAWIAGWLVKVAFL